MLGMSTSGCCPQPVNFLTKGKKQVIWLSFLFIRYLIDLKLRYHALHLTTSNIEGNNTFTDAK